MKQTENINATRLKIISIAAMALLLNCKAFAEQKDNFELKEGKYRPTPMDFGGSGLLQMPTARMNADGEIFFGTGYVHPYRRHFISLQALPWLEATFRYTSIENLAYSKNSPNTSFKDRGLDLQFRLIEENHKTPEIALGLRDIGGTQLFSSEYLVASKRFNNLDVTAGVAWGNAGTRGHLTNPLTYFFEGADNRATGTWGKLSANFFKGEKVGLFGGIEYETPIDGMRFKIEYDGNNYSQDYRQQLPVDSPVNVGVNYELTSWLDVTFGVERGNEALLRASMHSNFNKQKPMHKFDDLPPPQIPVSQLKTVKMSDAVTYSKQADKSFNSDMDNIPTVEIDDIWSSIEKIGFNMDTLNIKADYVELSGRTRKASYGEFARLATKIFKSEIGQGVDNVKFNIFYALEKKSVLTFNRRDIEHSIRLTGSPVALLPAPQGDWYKYLNSTESNEIGISQNENEIKITADTSASKENQKNSAFNNNDTINLEKIAANVFADMQKIKFNAEAFDIQGKRAILFFSQGIYRQPAIAFGRAAKIVVANVPDTVEEISLVATNDGVAVKKITVLRRDIEKFALNQISAEEVFYNTKLESASYEDLSENSYFNSSNYPEFSWAVMPKLRHHIGGGDKFYVWQLWAQAQADYKINRKLSVGSSLGVDIANSFEGFRQGSSDSVLPHVRSDTPLYIKGSKVWLNSLALHYIDEISDDVYMRLSSGIFELMYGGASGEILYRPNGKRWALGLDINYVRQRNYSGDLNFRDYKTVTGHLSYYYQLPWYNLDAVVRAGRYLAKDKGATIELSRTFNNGVTMGIFATKTNVSAKEFGEGSFDKGGFIYIPFDLFYTRSTKKGGGMAFRPLTRDGGQMVAVPKRLYGITDGLNNDKIARDWDELGN